jgi:hypothetical protein
MHKTVSSLSILAGLLHLVGIFDAAGIQTHPYTANLLPEPLPPVVHLDWRISSRIKKKST